jgi:uncharacterized damage-inducible protein DinB
MALATITQERLRSQLDCLPVLLAGTAAGDIDRRPASGKWSARENLAHLARYQQVFLERIGQILAQDRPAIGGYKAEDDPQWAEWATLPAEEVLARLQGGREQIIARVKQLSDAELERTGVHSRFGELTLAQWLEFFLLHEGHHLLAVLQRLHERK